jgi:mannose-6-phosphate isomerase-like protein (cupin superfamily)
VAHAGEVTYSPVTGESTTFVTTAADSNGTLLELDVVLDPHAAGGTEHIHPRITERYDLLEGRLHVRLEGVETVVGAGQKLEIPAGTAHAFWNADDEPVKVRVRYEPAGRFEEFIESIYALARDGKLNAKGRPKLLQASLIGQRHLRDIALANPPVFVQRLAFAVLAPIARARGYKEQYPG